MMSIITAGDVRDYVLRYLSQRTADRNLDGMQSDDADFDLLKVGIIDSMGVLEMIVSMEEHFKIAIDFEQMDAEEFTILRCFSAVSYTHLTLPTNREV